MSTKPKKPNPLASLQSANPIDWGKAFEALQYVQKDKHDGAQLHANADGSWMVIPTIRVYSPADCDAEKQARAFFESLRDEPAAQQAASKPSNSARKQSGKGRTRVGALDCLKSGKDTGK